MTSAINKTDATLHAFIDGQLSAHGKKKVQEYLKGNPAKRKETEANAQINEIMRKQFSIVTQRPLSSDIQKLLAGVSTTEFESQEAINDAPLPENDINLDDLDLQAITNVEPPQPGKWQFVFQGGSDLHSHLTLIIAAVTFLLGLFIGYLYPTLIASGSSDNEAMIRRLVSDAHRTYINEKAHAVEVSAKDITHLTNWLSSKLELAVAPAILSKFDFDLVGGRLLPSLGQNAAVYLYRKPDNTQLTLYIRNQSPLSGTRGYSCDQISEQSVLCSWQGENLSYYLITEDKLEHLRPLVEDAVSQLNQ